VVPGTSLIHSVDRLELAQKVSDRVSPGAEQPVLVQVNLTGQETQSGVEPGGLSELLDRLATLPHLRVDGLMTIGPFTPDPAPIRDTFRRLRELAENERSRGRPGMPLRDLSMGMTGDYEIAIEEGATIVRIGTAIFGERTTPPGA